MHPVAARQFAVVAPMVLLGLVTAGYGLERRLKQIARKATRQGAELDALECALTRLEVLAAAIPACPPAPQAGPQTPEAGHLSELAALPVDAPARLSDSP